MNSTNHTKSLVVAVDHEFATIARLLGRESTPVEANAIRRKIIDVVSNSNDVDGLIVNEQDYAWARGSNKMILLGLPDIGNETDIPKVAMQTGRAKIGIKIDVANQSDIVGKVRKTFSENPASIEWIVEPYFLNEHDIDMRVQILNELKHPQVVAFKLDLVIGTAADAYSKAVEPLPWYARTSGNAFESFVRLLRDACRLGCSGAFVGTAVWGDIFQEQEIQTFVDQINLRCRAIKAAIQLGD